MNVDEYRMNEKGNWILWEMNIGPESSCLCYKLKLFNILWTPAMGDFAPEDNRNGNIKFKQIWF